MEPVELEDDERNSLNKFGETLVFTPKKHKNIY